MSIEFRFAEWADYEGIARFIDHHWARDHIYVRDRKLFDWTFGRPGFGWESYSFAVAEEEGEIAGILGGIPFSFNCMGTTSPGVWFANFMIRAASRKGATAIRLLNLFRNPNAVTVAYGLRDTVVPFYRALRATIVDEIPRYVAVLPQRMEGAADLIGKANPQWEAGRAKRLAEACCWPLPDHNGGAVESLSPPPGWDEEGWSWWSRRSVGAARDSAYLFWRYSDHPRFRYRFIWARQAGRLGLLVWRLETVSVAENGGSSPFRLGRVVEFLPVSQGNAGILLGRLAQELDQTGALGADCTLSHGQAGGWLVQCGFHRLKSVSDGRCFPVRFQPLEPAPPAGGSEGAILSGLSLPDWSGPDGSSWYWTRSDADQDRPN